MDSADLRLLEALGQRLRATRLAQGLNLHQLARLTGISAPALSLIETGKRDPRLTTLARIAHALRLPLSDLLGAEERTAEPPRSDAPGYDLGDFA